ncbi:MAG: methyltransferase domain-containing protein [Alphaproteobacteria bacterium]|nr:methyltransferase domain-containing protein [Alphaproteobacteria bacterium]MBM3732907.1 methyltransferase domain-containing protein [Acidimicrobiia bacterium]
MLWQIAFETAPEAAPALAEAIEPLCLAVGWFGADTDTVWRVQGVAADPTDRAAIHAACAARALALRARVPDIRVTVLPERDWARDSLASFRPVQVGRYRIKGTHVAERPRAGVTLTLDAGLAFGTGEHASTCGCLRALDRMARGRIPARVSVCCAPTGARTRRRPARVLDLGCGTGVLAMAAAATWKASWAIASDIDPDATTTVATNVRRNRLAGRVRVLRADGFAARALVGRGRFDLVLANILARPLIRLARPIGRALAEGGIAVLAGFVAADAAWVAAPYRTRGFRLVNRIERDGWTTLVMRKRKP